VPRRANPASPPAAPLRLRVYRELRAAIEQGRFPPGARLPPSREHARALGVSRNTVLWALERLRAEGYVQARVGDGSYVAPDLAALRPARASGAHRPSAPMLALSRRGQAIADTALGWQPPQQPALPFRIGAPDVAVFPYALWDRLARQLGTAQRQSLAQYLDPAGLPALREAIAQWLWVSRGIHCDASQVMVCAGSQQALDLVARLLLDPGDEVLVEDPGYPGIRSALQGHGAQVRAVPLDGDGLEIDLAAQRWPAARLAVVTPTHQFPTGVRMGLRRRLALLDWARAGSNRWIVEDDYDGEFQYGAHRIPALTSLAPGERVLYVGTFSKTLHPGLRLGFIVMPHALAPAFAAARALADRHAAGEPQAVLARFITEGHLLRHLRRMRELYPQRQHALIEALADASGGGLRLAPSDQGMHLLLEADTGSDTALSARAQALGVTLAPLSRYAIESPRVGWLFGYAGFDTAALRAAAARVGPLFAGRPGSWLGRKPG